MRSIFLYMLVVLLGTGCSVLTPAPSKSNLPALDGDWIVRMAYSGGIAGLSRSIEISSDGKYVIMDERTSKTIMGEFTASELTQLKEQIASSEYYPNNKPEGGCADCFAYDLTIQGGGERFAVQLDDIGLQDAGLGTLINYLRSLIDAAL